MADGDDIPGDIPAIDLSDPAVARDPFTAYGRARERAPLARLIAPGLGPMWAVTRYADARAILADPRSRLSPASFLRPQVPEDCLPYLRTMQEMEGAEHARLRRLVAAAFTPAQADRLRPRIGGLVQALLDDRPGRAGDGQADLVDGLARPLPIEVICELIGIPAGDRPAWREYGGAVAAGAGQRFAAALPAIIDDARLAVSRRLADPADDLISGLLQAQGGDRRTDTEIVTLVWHLVLAALRADPGLMPGAVEELTRWCGPQLLSIPRYPRRGHRAARRNGTSGRAGDRGYRGGQPRPQGVRPAGRAGHHQARRAAGAPGPCRASS